MIFYFLFKLVDSVQVINWNCIQDDKDFEVWNCLVNNFWLFEKVLLLNDIQLWNMFIFEEQIFMMCVFMGFMFFDMIQGIVGVVLFIFDVIILYEEVVYMNIVFMELVYVKSYFLIFLMLCLMKEIDEVFCWLVENLNLQKKVQIVMDYYCGDDFFKCKVVLILFESFLFYLGFYLLMYWLSWVKFINMVDFICFIICDEVVYGYYIGYKFQCGFEIFD